ncbi:DNA polymerase III subunit alpha [Spirochaetota bacterium]
MTAPLLVSSYYSLGFGTAAPKALARRAKELGWPALGLSDRGGLYGLPEFMEACTDLGLKPLVCAELPAYARGLAMGVARGEALGTSDAYKKRILAIVMEKNGFARLCSLLSHRSDPGFELPSELKANHAGLALASDDEAFLHSVPDSHALLLPSDKKNWNKLLATGRRPLASGELRFLKEEDRELQRLLMAINRLCTIWDIKDDELSGPGCLPVSAGNFEKAYSAVPEALAANRGLSESIKFSSLFDGFVFPRHDSPPEAENKAADQNFLREKPCALLRRLVLDSIKTRYGPRPEARVIERMEYELDIIESRGFCDYFLAVRDIVAGASRSCGRGSAAASLVAYCLGISNVDPIKHSLYFERFLNPERKDPPDIDVDFAWDERDALLEKVMARYGEARSARVCNHVRFQSRAALRETARAFGMPDSEISAREKSGRDISAWRTGSVECAERSSSALSTPRANDPRANDPWSKIHKLSAGLIGLPRHLGVHSGGVILVPGEIEKFVPIERSGSGIRICSWDKDGVEAAGLVKIDLLGNRSLAVVRDALANAKDNGAGIDEQNWQPTEDPETIALLAAGDSMGVFYVESPAMRLLQKKTGRGDFEHIVIHSSIIRPAANRYINEYIERLKGKPYKAMHPALGSILDESCGIMCYQDDVCKVAIAAAGFSSGEADAVRKALSKRDAKERLPAFEKRFRDGATARGLDEKTITDLWDMICSFSGYSFVKAHSASYAMLSFQSAWLRRHRPAEFMAAVISNRGGYYSTLAYTSEARRMGLRILPPDVNNSVLACRGQGKTLRFGLGMIASLEKSTAEAILSSRASMGPYKSVDDFARRVKTDRTDAEALVGSGTMDELPGAPTREGKLMALLSAQAARENAPSAGQGELFTAEAILPSHKNGYTEKASEPGRKRRMQGQMRYLGTSLEEHPLLLYPEAMRQRRCLGRDLSKHSGQRVRLLAWPIASKSALTSAGEEMKFVSFEDESALYETIFFPDSYRRFERLLYMNLPLFVEGLVETNYGAASLSVENAEIAIKKY